MDFLFSAYTAILLKGLFTFMDYYRNKTHAEKHYVQSFPDKIKIPNIIFLQEMVN